MELNKVEKYTIEEVQKLFIETYERIERIEKKALSRLRARSQDAPVEPGTTCTYNSRLKEEIKAKLDEIKPDPFFTEHQEEVQKVIDALLAGDFKGLNQAQFLEKLNSYFGKEEKDE